MVEGQDKFTVYLDGQEGHRGNVLLHAFISKVGKLSNVLGKLERAYLDATTRQTDFEIINAEKVNPTSLTLRAVPHIRTYNPVPAFEWSMQQIRAVSSGVEPDNRITLDIADDLAKLSAKEGTAGYKAFWINGFAEKILFDEDFHAKAIRLVAQKKRELPKLEQWHEGKSIGSVVGELLKLDDFEHDREFIIVPPVGEPVTCVFPEVMRGEMGQYWGKVVRVSGILSYTIKSPFPARIEVTAGGVQLHRQTKPRRSLTEMRGAFAGRPRNEANWDSLLDG